MSLLFFWQEKSAILALFYAYKKGKLRVKSPDMKESLKIKLLTEYKQCIPALTHLWIDELAKTSDPLPDFLDVKQKFIDHCNKDKLPLAYVAVYQDKPIGMACLRITEGIENNLTPWLGGIVVHPDYRKNKIGERLVSVVKEHARILGYSKLYLLSYDVLSIWYKKLGWRKVDTIDNGSDIIIMSTSL